MIKLGSQNKQKVSTENIIGHIVEITHSPNKNLIGIKGLVVNETKNTFDVLIKGKRKKIIKSQVDFILEKSRVPGIQEISERKKISGKSITKKIQDRLKSHLK